MASFFLKLRHCEERSNLLINNEIATVYKKVNFAMTEEKRYNGKQEIASKNY